MTEEQRRAVAQIMVYRILGGLYLSSIEPLYKQEDLHAHYGIGHLLSVMKGDVDEQWRNQYELKQIEVDDEETENIVQYFEDTNKFIESGLFCGAESEQDKKRHLGGVLVHCAQGISRSATVVTAYLMWKYGLNYGQAFHAVQRKKNDVSPNEGFVRQLKLYADLHCCVNTEQQPYRQFLAELALRKDPSGGLVREMDFFGYKTQENNAKEKELRCRRCRQIVAYDLQLESHQPPESGSRQSQFTKVAPFSKRIVSTQEAAKTCTHFFLKEPLNWMAEQGMTELEGKFYCPKCETKIGGYSWRGSRCSCGKWMVPAVHLQSAKVDEMRILR